ncbi:MAG: nucleotidyltransferase domain-containing protein [Candidatus Andersenbacteria bacterium]|nr:nucleotidyltransferase domain-containing protein [Candidatus Andersenbacteria bacterium]
MTTEELQHLIDEVKEAIIAGYNPDEIVLFGSAARGDFTQGSDLDLLIVKETDKKPMQRVREVVNCLPHTTDVDVIVLTPQEKRARQQEAHYLMQEIYRQGKVLFSRHETSSSELA